MKKKLFVHCHMIHRSNIFMKTFQKSNLVMIILVALFHEGIAVSGELHNVRNIQSIDSTQRWVQNSSRRWPSWTWPTTMQVPGAMSSHVTAAAGQTGLNLRLLLLAHFGWQDVTVQRVTMRKGNFRMLKIVRVIWIVIVINSWWPELPSMLKWVWKRALVQTAYKCLVAQCFEDRRLLLLSILYHGKCWFSGHLKRAR